ncbi:ABC transporter substrate-binding protein [Pseudonocardia pini]|uniref:ABC transporter substrate-binding protein n=1 Tax=Pseudonocardia pini TaxID=2758030 RepID=UPI0015F00796|nr:ABC transporter substrate-binding protein [Pseudonocardia pini]
MSRLFGMLAVVASLVLVACGAPAPTTAAPSAATGEFPVTITHAYGTTTIPAKPQRVVAIGTGDLAVANAVGAPVVGALRNGTGGDGNLPYAATPLGAEVLGLDSAGDLDLERVAAYRPDLILATTWYGIADQADYDRLAGIAPVVTYETGLFQSSMEDDARLVGRALGETAAVEALIADANARIAALKAELPGLAGRTYLYGQARGEVLPMVVGEQNLSTAFMRSLGLSVPANFRDAPASAALAPGTVGVSYEEAGRLDSADVLFMTFATDGDRGRFEGNALVQQLRPVRAGDYLALTLDQAVALQAPNVAAVGWLLDGLRPTLTKVARAA